MTKQKDMRGHLDDDEIWEKRKGQMARNTLEHVAAKKKAAPAPETVEPLRIQTEIDLLKCTEDCPECHGDGYTDDHTGSTIECPKYSARKIMAGGDD